MVRHPGGKKQNDDPPLPGGRSRVMVRHPGGKKQNDDPPLPGGRSRVVIRHYLADLRQTVSSTLQMGNNNIHFFYLSA